MRILALFVESEDNLLCSRGVALGVERLRHEAAAFADRGSACPGPVKRDVESSFAQYQRTESPFFKQDIAGANLRAPFRSP